MDVRAARAVDIGTFQWIAAVTLTGCTVVMALLWSRTALPMADHDLFLLYLALTGGFALATLGLAALRALVRDAVETRLGRGLIHWLPELTHLLVYKHWLPGVITMTCYLVVPLSADRGLVDAWLAWPEQAIGLDHPTLYAWFRDAGLLPAAIAVYPLVEQQMTLLLVVSLVRRDLYRLWQFVAVLAVCSATSVVFLYLLPADGAWAFYEGRYGQPPPAPPAWLPELHALRADRIGDLEQAHGLLCFPSFHTVFAVLLARAFLDVRLLFVPMLLLNAAIVVSTVPVGWHYLSDVAGGLLLSAVGARFVDAVVAWRRLRAR